MYLDSAYGPMNDSAQKQKNREIYGGNWPRMLMVESLRRTRLRLHAKHFKI